MPTQISEHAHLQLPDSPDRDSELETLSETRSDHGLRKHDSHALLHGRTVEGNPEKVTVLRLFAILALAATFTGSSIPEFFMGPAIDFIGPSLHLGTERSWIPLSKSLASACIAPCVGYIQDLVGKRATIAIGTVLMLVGLITIGTSTGFAQAVVGSTLTGIASSLQELGAIAAIAELVPARQRGLFLALNTAFALCFTPALLYAELLNESGWRWLFWIALIWNAVSGIALALTYFRMKLERQNRATGKILWREIDYLGAALLIVGLILFLIALQSGGITHPWDSAYVLCQLVIGVSLLLALVAWESRGHGRPLIPFRLFHGQRVVGLAFLIGIMSSVNYFTVLNLGPSIIHSVFSFSPVGYGVIALGPSVALAVGATVLNILLTLLDGRARELITAATVLMTAFTGAQAIINPENSSLFAILGSFASLGIGGTLIPITTLVTLACPQDLIGTAVALTTTARTIGGTVGYAILYNVFISRSTTTVPTQMSTRLIAAGLPRNETAKFTAEFVRAITDGEPYPPANATIYNAALEGFRWGTAEGAQLVYYVTIPFGVLAVACSIALPNMRKYMTDRVLAQSQNP